MAQINIVKPQLKVDTPKLTVNPLQNVFAIGRTAILKSTIGQKRNARNANFAEKDFDIGVAQSYLGKPIKDPIIFGEIDKINSYIDSKGQTKFFETIALSEVITVVNLARNIVKTQIQGRDGTIKEYSNAGDYVINIQGRISGRFEGKTSTPTNLKNRKIQGLSDLAGLATGQGLKGTNTGNPRHVNIGNNFPATDLMSFNDLAKAGVSIPVTSKFLNNIFDISRIVIEDMSIARRQGFQNSVEISMNLLSDNDIIIDIDESDVETPEGLNDILNV